MKKFYSVLTARPWVVIAVFMVLFLICLGMSSQVAVNYDINEYLPQETHSTVSLDIMNAEFDGGIPNARVMLRNVTIPEALEYKEKIAALDGVLSITWLDDSMDISVPLAVLEPDALESYYKDNTAIFSVTVDKPAIIVTMEEIREIIGEENAMTGTAASIAASTTNTVIEVKKITVIAVIFVLLVLILTTQAWIEPLLVLGGLGVAIVLNNGTNLIFGEISFVTNAAGSILLLAVSLDYSVFLLHRLEECRSQNPDIKSAMVEALCKSTSSILSSGLTTVIGFLALALMRFLLGPDLGLALGKGIVVCLVTVFIFMPSLILVTYKLIDKTQHRNILPSFRCFGKFVLRIMIPMVCVFAIILVPSYLASNANDYYYGTSRIFGEETKLGADTIAVEEVFGKNDTYVLLIPNSDMAVQEKLSDELHALPHVTDILSYVDTVGAEVPTEYLDENTLSLLMSENYTRMVLSVDVPYEGDQTFALVEQIRETANKYYPDAYYLAGQGVSTYDLMDTIVADMFKVNLLAIGAVLVVLLITMRSISLPVILVLGIETAIWLNLSIPYFTDSPIFYIAYLIISSIQLGATVDYAILLTDRYKENRQDLEKKEAIVKTISDCTVSILTSGSVLTVVGLLLGYISSNQLLAQLGIFIGRGAIFSLLIVLFVLPGLLYLADRLFVRKKNAAR